MGIGESGSGSNLLMLVSYGTFRLLRGLSQWSTQAIVWPLHLLDSKVYLVHGLQMILLEALCTVFAKFNGPELALILDVPSSYPYSSVPIPWWLIGELPRLPSSQNENGKYSTGSPCSQKTTEGKNYHTPPSQPWVQSRQVEHKDPSQRPTQAYALLISPLTLPILSA